MNDPVLEAVDKLCADIEADIGDAATVTTRALIVAEFLDADGSRRLYIIRDRQIRNWDIRGMLLEVIADLDAFDIVNILDG
ncbi:MAG: hypothetical protein P1T08_12865 [Acidimicrobiia bacterium]|nr:hypothetical protein [Acidimicrobiia bacterium]